MPIRHLHNAVKCMGAVSPPHTQKFSGILINTVLGAARLGKKPPSFYPNWPGLRMPQQFW